LRGSNKNHSPGFLLFSSFDEQEEQVCWQGRREDDEQEEQGGRACVLSYTGHDASKCREHDPDMLDDDCCGYDYETWCADGYTLVRGEMDAEECWPGGKGYICVPGPYVSCRSCQGGCGSYCSQGCECAAHELECNTSDECLNDDHTIEIDGVEYGICDSDGETLWDGRPCVRD